MRTLTVLGLLALASSALAADVGQPAPGFTLKDVDGNVHRLSDHKDKIVVLEWFNPGCPFVVNSHTKGSLMDTAADLLDGDSRRLSRQRPPADSAAPAPGA